MQGYCIDSRSKGEYCEEETRATESCVRDGMWLRLVT